MTPDITSKLLMLLAAYTLVHGAVYIWSQGDGNSQGGPATAPGATDYGKSPKRRFASRINSGRSRHQLILLTAMIAAASLLTGFAVMASGL